jgi:4-alpha-glucanotransferase
MKRNPLRKTLPFPAEGRTAGVLLHITSLPSPYGIGDMGPTAFDWVNRLHDAGQRWWQALPLGPTGYGDSPYQSLSSFAGNGLLISPESIVKDGLLHEIGLEALRFSHGLIEYGTVARFKHGLLDQVWGSFKAGVRRDLRRDYEHFCHEQAHWLEDYALFRALKKKCGGISYLAWPMELIKRDSVAVTYARKELSKDIDQVRFAQFLIFRQGQRLKEHANAKGIGLIGDLPFFVSPDSSDVWAHPELFLLDEKCRPRFVAGVPPDYFSADGQLWGNPVYDWDALRRTGFQFWIDRVRTLLAYVDVIRLDHFRAFIAAWQVPAEAPTARTGFWATAPGAEFFATMQRELGELPFIAEDLGLITPDVCALRDQFQIPGTKVLQFAFDGDPSNPHLPANYPSNSVVYTGTHDNNTTRGWYEALSEEQQRRVWNCLRRSDGDTSKIAGELVQQAWSSRAMLAIAPVQDLLELGAEARMNRPGYSDGNWRWRATKQMLNVSVFEGLRKLTEKSGRSPLSHKSAIANAFGVTS